MTAVMNRTGITNLFSIPLMQQVPSKLRLLVVLARAAVWLDSVGCPESLGEDLEVAEACNVQ